jgi:hypothetical protein
MLIPVNNFRKKFKGGMMTEPIISSLKIKETTKIMIRI